MEIPITQTEVYAHGVYVLVGAIQITTNTAQGQGSSPKLVLNGVLC